jgi:hypothetical protein
LLSLSKLGDLAPAYSVSQRCSLFLAKRLHASFLRTDDALHQVSIYINFVSEYGGRWPLSVMSDNTVIKQNGFRLSPKANASCLYLQGSSPLHHPCRVRLVSMLPSTLGIGAWANGSFS